ncbi:hyaluronan and proteoglycan link protein 4-like protein [Lates japonicus]|uniref:Hyaluronan and proteoglycan link protein 4-like protein n=1 Tax=Lates japonicus TaxID=270547 RepID=A0AAD3R4P0_LATJO|nr:hyaluronan and proteoglycan link protein 4-like protein [Lates japonicus]
MWRTPLEQTGTAALYLGLILSHLVGEGSVVKVLCQPGERVTLPCSYHYEDHTHISQLSVQWRSPHNELLCHYIKHKAFQNCTAGYTIIYSPGSITLTIQQVKMEDFGAHVCSVGKRHEFSDYNIELARMPDRGGEECGPAEREDVCAPPLSDTLPRERLHGPDGTNARPPARSLRLLVSWFRSIISQLGPSARPHTHIHTHTAAACPRLTEPDGGNTRFTSGP